MKKRINECLPKQYIIGTCRPTSACIEPNAANK